MMSGFSLVRLESRCKPGFGSGLTSVAEGCDDPEVSQWNCGRQKLRPFEFWRAPVELWWATDYCLC